MKNVQISICYFCFFYATILIYNESEGIILPKIGKIYEGDK